MNEKRITPKIIELAKAIAELWRMEIYVGCWITRIMGGDLSGKREYKAYQVAWLLHRGFQIIDTTHGLEDMPIKYFPIPSIADCVEKLVEMGYESMNLQRRPFKHPWMIDVWDAESHDLDVDTIKRWDNKGKGLHEAALSITLEALRKEVSDE